jgi:hypothetical protein
MRMATEIDAGQARGEVARAGGDRDSIVRDSDNRNEATLDELGVSRQRLAARAAAPSENFPKVHRGLSASQRLAAPSPRSTPGKHAAKWRKLAAIPPFPEMRGMLLRHFLNSAFRRSACLNGARREIRSTLAIVSWETEAAFAISARVSRSEEGSAEFCGTFSRPPCACRALACSAISGLRARASSEPPGASEIRGRLYNRLKKQGARTDITSAQNEQKSEAPVDTAQRIADQQGVSRATVVRDGQFADAVDEQAGRPRC